MSPLVRFFSLSVQFEQGDRSEGKSGNISVGEKKLQKKLMVASKKASMTIRGDVLLTFYSSDHGQTPYLYPRVS